MERSLLLVTLALIIVASAVFSTSLGKSLEGFEILDEQLEFDTKDVQILSDEPIDTVAYAFIDRLRQDAFADQTIFEQQITDLQGWIADSFEDVIAQALVNLHDSLQRPIVILDVGTWKGLATHTIASVAKANQIPVDIIAIDTWLGNPQFWTDGIDQPDMGAALLKRNGFPQVYFEFINLMWHFDHQDVISPLPLSSTQAAEVLRFYNIRADIIYIDADKEYEAVKEDVANFWGLLQYGGVMIGDGYTQDFPGVIQAVDQVAESIGIPVEIHDSLWVLQS